jgi:serine/threonine protein kinase
MAPERALSQQVGTAADVYALGGGTGLPRCSTTIVGKAPPTAAQHRIGTTYSDLGGIADTDLRALIGECLDKDTDQRPDAVDIRRRTEHWTTEPGTH